MWVAEVILVGISLFIILRSLAKARPKQSHNTITFYQSQIAEIDHQQSQNLISAPDAELAKAQAARGLLKSQPEQEIRATTQKPLRITALALIAFVPAVALPCYALLGSPDMIDKPLATRERPKPVVSSQVEQLEALLKNRPNDNYAEGRLLAIYKQGNQPLKVVELLQSIITRRGSTPERETDLGEAMIMANNGTISDDAKLAFERALVAQPKFAKARYYMGRFAVQEHDDAKAKQIWTELVSNMPQGALRAMVEGEIAKLDKK